MQTLPFLGSMMNPCNSHKVDRECKEGLLLRLALEPQGLGEEPADRVVLLFKVIQVRMAAVLIGSICLAASRMIANLLHNQR